MLAIDEPSLRGFCARVLGYERTQAIEHAMRSIRLSATYSAALLLLGDSEADLESVARGLHRRVIGDDRPFVVCDRRLLYESSTAVSAAQAARGGSLYVRRRRLPDDYPAAIALLRDPTAAVQLIICAEPWFNSDLFTTLPVPIELPSLETRKSELPRIVDDYTTDATRTLGGGWLSDVDREWVLEHAAGSLLKIERATLRLAAIRKTGSVTGAARLLGMTASGLNRWFHSHRALHRGEIQP